MIVPYHNHTTSEINQSQIKIRGLIAKLEDNQNQRVLNYGQKFKDRAMHEFESQLSEISMPTKKAEIDLQVTRLKNRMIEDFRTELGALKKYPSVGVIEQELASFAESRRDEQHMHNEDEWRRLVKEPVKKAKTAFLRHGAKLDFL